MNDFHAHLDGCRQCREHPMDLCRVGARLLAEAFGALPAERDPNEPCCDENCERCSGEYCDQHFNEPCDCDVVERHTDSQGVHRV